MAEYARICLKYNVKDTVKLLQKLVSIYKRETRHIRNCIKRPGYDIKNIPWRLNMLCDRNMPGIHKVLNMREYALE